MLENESLVAVNPFDYSIIQVTPGWLLCKTPREVPKNFPIRIIVDGKETTSVLLTEIKDIRNGKKIDVPQNTSMFSELEPGLNSILLSPTLFDPNFTLCDVLCLTKG